MNTQNIFKFVVLALLALLFNGEMYAHSYGAFLIPELLIFYLIIIIVANMLMKRYKFDALGIFLFGSGLGLLLETFYSRSIFVSPFFLGVNWLSVAIQFLYWGMAALLPFYVWKTITKKRFKINLFLNVYVVLYLVLEFILNAFIFYPQTIWVWIILGAPLGIYTLVLTKKHKLLV